MRHESTSAVNQSRLLWVGVFVLAAALGIGFAPGARADVLFNDIGAGGSHTCAVKANNELACWGSNSAGQANPPPGTFRGVSAGGSHTCGRKYFPGDPEDSTVACWGDNTFGQASPASGQFRGISAGLSHTCGVKSEDSTVACWGDNTFGQATPPAGRFRFVSAGGGHTCGVREEGNTVACWGNNTLGQAAPPAGTFVVVSAGRAHTCGFKADARVVCWGDNAFGQAAPPPTEQFSLDASGGGAHTCVVRAFEGSVGCWGSNALGQAIPPGAGPLFSKVSAGGNHSCGLTTGGRVVCWGANAVGQATPPADSAPLVGIVFQGCSPCRAGDVARISLDFSNPGPRRTVEVTAVSHFPDGVTVQRLLDDDQEVTLPAGESALVLPPITIPAGSIGTFVLEAALLDNVTGFTLSRHSVPVRVIP